MKSLALVFIILNICQLAFVSGDFKVHNMIDVAIVQNACNEELKPPQEMWEQFLNLKFPPHESTACFVKCMIGKLNFFDEDAGFILDNIIAQVTHKDSNLVKPMKLALEKCIKRDADMNSCDWALRGFKCFMKDNSDAVIMSFAIVKKKKKTKGF